MSLAGFFEFDETHFVNGQARLLFSKLNNGTLTNAPVPSSPADIFGQVSPYVPIAPSGFSPWVDLGGLTAPPEYGIARTISQWRVQQQISAVKAVPSEVVRTIKFTAGEFTRADIMQMLENGPATSSVSSATGHSAFTKVPFGQFTDLNQYRFAIAAFQPLDAGTVLESGGGAARPRLVVQVLNRCAVDADSSSVPYGIGEMVVADLTMRSYPEPGANQNEEFGAYYFEAAGTIT